MTTTPIKLQDLRRRIDAKAKAAPSWRFWGLYVHIWKPEILHEAYQEAKANNGAPGVDGVTCEAIEANGLDAFLAQIRHALVTRTSRPMRLRHKAIPKEGCAVKALYRNAEMPMGVQAPNEPLSLSIAGHLAM
jgi:RNA-directed DNA polymerase